MADEPLETRSPWSDEEIRTLRTRLLDFFDEVRRPLPWREARDPYAVLVSEVMSQQTRVEAVVPYYRRWMERFPDPASLAAAHEDEVLAHWQGLGYYSRARNLHRTAREIEVRHDGLVPADPAELQRLPGVGPYTAGAVASMAFDVPVPAVDGNVRRVLARLTDDPAPSPRRLEALAGALVDPERPGDFNQALMELGALVCTPRSPQCRGCPVSSLCAARLAGTQGERPTPRRRGAVPAHDHGVAVVVAPPGAAAPGEPRFFLIKRPERGLLAGMWAFPEARVHRGEDPAVAAARARRVADVGVAEVGVAERSAVEDGDHEPPGAPGGTEPAEPLAVVDHAFSHLRVSYHPFVFAAGGPLEGSSPAWKWVTAPRSVSLALPAAQRRILRDAREYWASRGPS